MKKLSRALIVVVAFALGGCASYTTPGAGVAIPNLVEADADVRALFEIEPASPFPARVAVARVQAPGYYSSSNSCSGTGAFCVVTTRDVEPEKAFSTLTALPEVSDLARITRLMLPATLSSSKDLRLAAASLKSDILLIYSIDTLFNIDSTDIGPLALVSLGFLPNKQARVTSTASSAIIDVRTGFLYGVAEATATESQRATTWSTSAAVDASRQEAESRAFQDLVVEIESLWSDILETHSSSGS